MLKKSFLFLLILVSCNNNKKEQIQGETSNDSLALNKPNELVVIMTFNTNKPDTFKFILNNIFIDEFQKKNIHILEKTIPTTDYGKIVAKFGANNISNVLQISLGGKEVKEVEIKSIDISFADNNLHISGNEIDKYFKFNKFISFEKSSNKLVTKKINGKHVPYMTLKKSFIKKLRE